MRYKSALLIYNGNAGQKDIEHLIGASVPILISSIQNLSIHQTVRPGHARELCKIHGPHVDLVIILGGDGTVHECINGLANLDKRPVIGILPGGTCNDFTRTLQINQDIRRATEEMINGEEVPVDVLKVDDQFSLNFWGVGLIAEASLNIEQTEKDRLGKISYFLSAFRTLREMDLFEYEMEIDGEKITGEALMILVSNGAFIGTNSLPFQSVKYDDGFAEILIVNNINLSLLKELSTLNLTQDIQSCKEIDHYRGRSITVLTPKDMDADMDGEVYMKTPSQITVLKHHFSILKPQNQN